MLASHVPLLARTPEEIRAEARRALAVHRELVAEGDMDEARRIEAHVAAAQQHHPEAGRPHHHSTRAATTREQP